MKQISIIIPNKNSTVIDRVCRSLHRQTIDLADVEVLVIGIDHPQLVHEDSLVRFIRTNEKATASVNRNVGLHTAEGNILVFLDSDCIPACDWLATHMAHHAQGKRVVGGAIAFGESNYFQLADNVSAFHDLLPFTSAGERPYLVTANMSIHRDVWTAVGDMQHDLTRAEDLEWSVRIRKIGYKLHFDPQAVVTHDPPRTTFRSVWRHWVLDAPDTLRVRLQEKAMLHTPLLARFRFLYLWAAPLIALWATMRAFAHPLIWRRYIKTWPMVYLTKVAWCWGAFRSFPSSNLNRQTLVQPVEN